MTADSSQFYPRTPVTRKVELTCFGSKEKIIGRTSMAQLKSGVLVRSTVGYKNKPLTYRDRASGIGGIFPKYGVVRLGRQLNE